MNLLHVDSIRKSVGDRTILNDVFLNCKQGEIVGLLGRNGSGKSSLLKIVFGSSTADNKYVAVDSLKTGSLFSTRNLIHYLPQHSFLPNHIKIKRLVACLCDKEATKNWMKNEFMLPFLDKKAKQLSGGERRIVEIMMLLGSKAKVVLLDEPFHGISPIHIERIKSLIKIYAIDKAIVITDHSYQNVIDISNRIILIEQGNTRQIKEMNELIEFGYLPASIYLDQGTDVT